MEWRTTSTVLERLHDFEDKDVWELLVEHFEAPLTRLAMRMGLSSADAQDVAQETLVAFAASYRQGRFDRSRGRLKHWLFGIAQRQAANARRRVRNDRARRQADFDESGALDVAGDDGAAGAWDEEWKRAVFERAVRQAETEVRPETFRVFRMLVIEGLPADEVCRALSIPRTMVYNAKHRVTKRIKELARLFEDA